jgi:hypothetical protein
MKEADSQLFALWKKSRVQYPNVAALAVDALCCHDLGEDFGRGHLGTHLAIITWCMQKKMMTADGT